MATVAKIGQRREKIRKQYWRKDIAWTGDGEAGWFRAPRTLPLILSLLGSKAISGKKDPSSVYQELYARHLGQGVIEMSHEADHAFAAGYEGTRAVRTWEERMRILEAAGFIKTVQVGNQRYKYVLLVHPAIAVEQLREAGKIPVNWWKAYRARQIETKETTPEQRMQKKAGKVVSMVASDSTQPSKAVKAK